MTIADCATLVHKADPDRFLAVMAAPVAARARLFPLYAFNIEVTRVPWLTEEPMIAEMRLQWWRDVVENAASGAARAHEVAEPLHEVIREADLPVDVMDRLIAARIHDAWGKPFEDEEEFAAYIEETGAALMWLAARALGAPDEAEPVARAYGWAAALANYLVAVPDLVARGIEPLPDPAPERVAALARRGLDALRKARAARRAISREVAPAFLAGWQAPVILRRTLADPERVTAGALRPSEFSRRSRLFWQAFTARW